MERSWLTYTVRGGAKEETALPIQHAQRRGLARPVAAEQIRPVEKTADATLFGGQQFQRVPSGGPRCTATGPQRRRRGIETGHRTESQLLSSHHQYAHLLAATGRTA